MATPTSPPQSLAGSTKKSVPANVEQIESVSEEILEAQPGYLVKEDIVDDPDAHVSVEEKRRIERALLWKLDLHLIPWVSLLYLVSFLDRANIGNAKIVGLPKDLHLRGNQYNDALTIFFVAYALFEPVTNILLKRLRPSVFLPTIMVLWGICMTTMGLAHNFQGLMAARCFLGLTEAGLFPGVTYLLSCWYKRCELGIRIAIFFAAAAIAGSFGGLLAAALAKMNGIGKKPGWAWIFIIEGLATIVFGVASFWLVHDFPDEATFLSEDDRNRAIYRLAEDKQASAKYEKFEMVYFWACLKDWKTYIYSMIMMGTAGAIYAFALFLPTIIKELVRYSSTRAQLLSVPPFAVAALLTIVLGYIADRTGKRGLCNIFVSFFGIAGFSMLLGAKSAHVRYAGTFLGAMGIYPVVANTISWAANNTEGVYKRGTTIGIMVGCANLSGIVSSNIYRTHDAPHFYPGHGTVLAYITIFQLGGSILLHVLLRIENGKRLRGERDIWIQGLDKEAINMRGDKRPDFLYML